MEKQETLFTLIKSNVSLYKDKEVIYKISDNRESRSYKNLIDRNFLAWLENVPKHTCLGVCIGIEPCIPMIIYSLMEKGLCFMFLDSNDCLQKNEKIVKELKLYGLISCDNQYKWPQYKERKTIKTECNPELHVNFNPVFDYQLYQGIFYIISTSGTCGNIKYVRVTEESIKSNILSIRRIMNITSDDVIYFGTPLTFDPSMIELFLALTTGAKLVSVSKDIWHNPSTLLTSIFPQNEGVTFLQMCPSVFTRWSDYEINFIFTQTTLRILALGGEPFPQMLLDIKRKPGLKIFNLYGITEVSSWASVCDIQDDVHLGEVLDDTILEVRDENGFCITEGCGEMFIGSSSRICLLNDETHENIHLPIFRATGDLVHVRNNIFTYQDRLNRVVKRFGHRINLNALEENIKAKTDLNTVCIWDEKTQQISAFILVPNNNENRDKILDKIRVKLLKELESKFFPDHLDIIDEIPLTVNGKIDLKKIKNLAPKSNLDLYKKLWCKYLCVSIETADERKFNNFVEMGGNSIMRLQFVSELKEMSKGRMDSVFINKLLECNFKQACELLQTETEKNRYQETKYFKVNWYSDMLMCIDAPATIFIHSERLYVAVGNFANIFAIFDALSGTELYKVVLPKTIENACSALIESGKLYVGCFDGAIYCVDFIKKSILWKYSTGDMIKNTGCFSNDYTTLVFGSYDKNLHCIKVHDGSLVWKKDFKGPITSNPVCINGSIIAASIKGTIICLKEKSADEIWKYKTKQPIFTHPKIMKACILYSDVGGCIHAINLESGDLVWNYEPPISANMFSSFLLFKHFIIFGMKDRNIYFLTLNENICEYSHCVKIAHDVNAEPKVFEINNQTYLLFISIDGYILLYKLINKDLQFVDSMNLGAECFAHPVFNGKTMFVGCRDNHFYSIDIKI